MDMIDPMHRFTYRNIRKVEITEKIDKEKSKKEQKKQPKPKDEEKIHKKDEHNDEGGIDFYA